MGTQTHRLAPCSSSLRGPSGNHWRRAVELLSLQVHDPYRTPGTVAPSGIETSQRHRHVVFTRAGLAGYAMLEITRQSGPCDTLDVYGPALKREIKADDPSSPGWGLSGFYASVLHPGRVRPDDIISVVATLA